MAVNQCPSMEFVNAFVECSFAMMGRSPKSNHCAIFSVLNEGNNIYFCLFDLPFSIISINLFISHAAYLNKNSSNLIILNYYQCFDIMRKLWMFCVLLFQFIFDSSKHSSNFILWQMCRNHQCRIHQCRLILQF